MVVALVAVVAAEVVVVLTLVTVVVTIMERTNQTTNHHILTKALPANVRKLATRAESINLARSLTLID